MVAALWSIEPKQLRDEFGVPRHAIKLLYPLKNLNPTNKLAISDWIIKFCAAAGQICAMAFSDPVPKIEFRLHFKLTGAGFWDDMDGMSEVEFFDDLYNKYLERYAFINGVVASFIIGHVEWEKEPALARCIRDLPGVPGWGSTGNGKAMYDWLVKHGSTDDKPTQELLISEWSTFLIESRLTKQGLPRTRTVFTASSTAEDVIDRMAGLLDLYEKVEEHRSAPSHVFIKVMVQLISDDVPSLRDWGTRYIVDLLTGVKSITGTRSAWVAGEASALVRAYLPMRSLAFSTSLRDDHAPGALNALNNQRAGPSNGARPTTQSSSNRPPFQNRAGSKDGYKGQSKGAGLNDKTRFGLCSFCDARGCQNADNPKAGIDTCSVFGGCACKPNASPDEVQYVELQRKFLKEAGPKSKYHSSPYTQPTHPIVTSNPAPYGEPIPQPCRVAPISPAAID